ncbi:probable gluconokinase isoform X2 [Polyodon spathula]|nr:probable gluconokinase isoform X2 [Polyodon spathula]
MSSGIPLNDQDRIPWLQILHDIIIREWSSGRNVILACSALKKLYRQILAMGSEILDSITDEKFPSKDMLFVFLHGTIELITKRLAARKGHYMAENLIQSQFDALEPPAEPENFITVEIAKSTTEIMAEIENALCNHGNCLS